MDVHGNALYFSRLPIPFPRDGEETIYYKHLGVLRLPPGVPGRLRRPATGHLEQVEKLEQLRPWSTATRCAA